MTTKPQNWEIRKMLDYSSYCEQQGSIADQINALQETKKMIEQKIDDLRFETLQKVDGVIPPETFEISTDLSYKGND